MDGWMDGQMDEWMEWMDGWMCVCACVHVCLMYDTIFIYCNRVSTRCQWSVDLYRNGKETAQKAKQ